MKLHDGLQQILHNHKDKDNQNLSKLLNQFYKKIQKEDFKEPIKNFEDITSFIRNNAFIYKNPKTDEEINNYKKESSEKAKTLVKFQEILKVIFLANFPRKKPLPL